MPSIKMRAIIKQTIGILLTVVSFTNGRLLSETASTSKEEPLEYFNVKDKSFLLEYPQNGPVIAILLASREQDVVDICVALKSLVFWVAMIRK